MSAKPNTWLKTAIAVLALAASLPSLSQADEERYLGEGAKEAKSCIEPTELMRRDHMLMLFKQRDLTVHQGIRTKKYSLTHCISCHAKKDAEGEWISQNSPEHFCQGCHVFTGTKIDCFECHAGHPGSDSK